MSNYPPGVTGNEYEIAGPDSEFEEEFECWNERFEYVRIAPHVHKFCSDLGKKINRTPGVEELKNNYYRNFSLINVMFNMPSISPEIVVEECDFNGVVLKESFRGKTYWSCPKCGKDYEEDIEIERDYYDD